MATTPDLRRFLSFSLLTAGAVITTFIVYLMREDSPEDRRPALQLAYYLDTATLTGTGSDGAVLYSVTTRRAQQMDETGDIQLDDIAMEYGAPDGLPWNLRADQGRIPEDVSRIELAGNIVAMSGAGHPRPTEIRTRRLTIDPETMRATSDGRVTLIFDNRRLNAIGMVADFRANTLQLLSNVNGKFVP